MTRMPRRYSITPRPKPKQRRQARAKRRKQSKNLAVVIDSGSSSRFECPANAGLACPAVQFRLDSGLRRNDGIMTPAISGKDFGEFAAGATWPARMPTATRSWRSSVSLRAMLPHWGTKTIRWFIPLRFFRTNCRRKLLCQVSSVSQYACP
jgi:hypothetical protein